MVDLVPAHVVASDGGILLVAAILTPVAALLLAVLAGPSHVRIIAGAALALGLAIAAAIAATFLKSGVPIVYHLGGWAPPLGIALRADGLSVAMLGVTAFVLASVALYAWEEFDPKTTDAERPASTFWLLNLGVAAGLYTAFLASDLFTLYVALELLTFSAAPLVCVHSDVESLRAALRYLLFAIVGSMFYVAGVVLLYGAYGTLDIALLAQKVAHEPITFVAASLITAGLLAKSALFPLHFWLPPAHAAAPTPASAVLSALVVKGSFFIALRFWFGVILDVAPELMLQLVGVLAAGAIVVGNVIALRQERMKLLIAYSTLAQLGLIFLVFALARSGPSDALHVSGAGVLQAMSHATAKASMFLAAGLAYTALGHDRISELAGLWRVSPAAVAAFALSGLALIGVPPSGASVAKEAFLQAAAATNQWWLTVLIQLAGVLTASYVVVVLAHALSQGTETRCELGTRSPRQEAAALSLAIASLVLGAFSWEALLGIDAGSSDFAGKLFSTIALLFLGAAIAVLLGRIDITRFGVQPPGVATALSDAVDAVNETTSRWPVASFSIVGLCFLFVVAAILGP